VNKVKVSLVKAKIKAPLFEELLFSCEVLISNDLSLKNNLPELMKMLKKSCNLVPQQSELKQLIKEHFPVDLNNLFFEDFELESNKMEIQLSGHIY